MFKKIGTEIPVLKVSRTGISVPKKQTVLPVPVFPVL